MKLIDWILGLFGKQKDEIDPKELAAWPFPAVDIKTKPCACELETPKKKRGRPAGKKTVAKKTAKKPAVKTATKKAKKK